MINKVIRSSRSDLNTSVDDSLTISSDRSLSNPFVTDKVIRSSRSDLNLSVDDSLTISSDRFLTNSSVTDKVIRSSRSDLNPGLDESLTISSDRSLTNPSVTDKVIRSSRSDLNPTVDLDSLTISSGEKLPHWQCNDAIYHISFRLADSVPRSLCERWLREREYLIANANQLGNELFEDIEKKVKYLYSEKIEKYLDVGHGKCYLRRAEIANLVANSFTHFDNRRYLLHAWCIMPNHVHVIVEAMLDNDLSKIIHSWKSYTAHRANKILGCTGAFWQRDAYNHIIRSRKEYHFQIQYTWNNPEKARLQGWKWRWKTAIDQAETA